MRIFCPVSVPSTPRPSYLAAAQAPPSPSLALPSPQVVTRAREAFAKQEAYETAGRTSAPPGIPPADARRDLPFNRPTAFDLTPGELSRVYSDQTAYYIYKVQSRWAARHRKAKDEIRSTLEGAPTRHQQASVNASLSQAYFGEPGRARMVPLGKQQ